MTNVLGIDNIRESSLVDHFALIFEVAVKRIHMKN
jgi:hypothetical protein